MRHDLVPAGAFNRAVNAPACVGSPFKTAIWPPAGNPGGASPHFKSAGLTTRCSAVADADADCSAASTNAAAATIILNRMVIFFMIRTISPEPVRGQALPGVVSKHSTFAAAKPSHRPDGRIIEVARYFAAFCLGFFEASRSAFLRRAARFLILSLPRLCPIRFQNFTI
jgi:hypothetical protein